MRSLTLKAQGPEAEGEDSMTSLAAVVAKATGPNLSATEALELAQGLRATVAAAGHLSGPDAALAGHLHDAAEILEDEVAHRRRPR
jgi:hypothetical protein